MEGAVRGCPLRATPSHHSIAERPMRQQRMSHKPPNTICGLIGNWVESAVRCCPLRAMPSHHSMVELREGWRKVRYHAPPTTQQSKVSNRDSTADIMRLLEHRDRKWSADIMCHRNTTIVSFPFLTGDVSVSIFVGLL